MGRVNEADLDWEGTDRAAAIFRRKRLAAAAGGEDIGCSLYELPPGACAWPYHWHAGNEEALYVLAGEGTIRLDGDRAPLRPGDYVALPAGEGSAHRVINDGDDPLRYLAVSTMDDPDVIRYPDSGKVGVYAGSPPGSEEPRSVHGYFREDDAVDYWLDEDGADATTAGDEPGDAAGGRSGADGRSSAAVSVPAPAAPGRRRSAAYRQKLSNRRLASQAAA